MLSDLKKKKGIERGEKGTKIILRDKYKLFTSII